MKTIRNISLVLLALVAISCQSSDKSSDEVRVLSFNIRYDNPDDTPNDWASRKPLILDFIRSEQPDIMGLQEVLAHQYDALRSECTDYAAYGVGREDGKLAGEFCPVFFRKDRFAELSQGHCWLSETPSVPAKGWDAACERMAVWVMLRELKTQKEFLFINTHFDHMGEVARRESSRMILELADSLSGGRPVILTGDFNADPSSEVVSLIVDSTNPKSMKDSRYFAQSVEGDAWTFHDFGKLSTEERPLIDYIFLRGAVTPIRHTIYHEEEQQGHIFLSDHAPVLLNVIFD